MSVTCATSRATKRSSWPRVADAAVYYALSVSFLSHCLTHTASTESTAVSHLVLLSAQQMNSYIRTQGGSAECSGLTNAYGLDSIYVGGKKLIHMHYICQSALCLDNIGFDKSRLFIADYCH